MKDGRNFIEKAEREIYENQEIELIRKADLLTAMAIFAGLKDKEMSLWLINRRRDIMIRSAAYEIIKEEGIKEGEQQGIKQTLIDILL